MAASYPPTTSQAHQDHLLTTFKDFSLSHGLTVFPPSTPNPHLSLATHAPVSLYPTLFPSIPFHTALSVQPTYNTLYARISSTPTFLTPLSAALSKVDTFIASLFRLYTHIESHGGPAQPLSLGLFRSDYMLHAPEGEDPVIHQVEFNTIASSFGGLATQVSALHRHLVSSGAYPETPELTLDAIPRNPAAEGLAAGLAAAHEAYGATSREKVVLFIVQPGERNVFDQRWLEYALLENHGVRTHRLSLAEVGTHTKVGAGKELLLATPQGKEVEVSTVYFRAGYGPDDYAGQHEWDMRLLLEESRAIKCPTVATQLAGSKKVQQVLAVPGELEKLISDPEEIAQIRATFAAIYPLDKSTAGMEARRLAFEEPGRFVLKPQREGGGNNIYREKIPAFLKEIGEEMWEGYILMEMIETPPAEGVIVRNGECLRGGVISELGVYGAVLWRGEEVLVNTQCGWLLRTKGVESEEGGVAAGFGCVDGVCLV